MQASQTMPRIWLPCDGWARRDNPGRHPLRRANSLLLCGDDWLDDAERRALLLDAQRYPEPTLSLPDAGATCLPFGKAL